MNAVLDLQTLGIEIEDIDDINSWASITCTDNSCFSIICDPCMKDVLAPTS